MKEQRQSATQRYINALVAEHASFYFAKFTKMLSRERATLNPQTPLPVSILPELPDMDTLNYPVTPPRIPLVATIYPVPVTSPQTTGDDMQALNNNNEATTKRPAVQKTRTLNETTKQADNNTSIENIVAAAVIAYQKSHNKRNPPFITIHPIAQTILEIREYAKGGHILKDQGGDPSSIKIRVNPNLRVDQIICGEVNECH